MAASLHFGATQTVKSITLLVIGLIIPALVWSNVQTTEINSDQSKAVWSGWNVTGTLHFKIINTEGEPVCVRAWWNNLGRNTKQFELCDGSSLDYKIPAYLFSRLKVGWPEDTVAVAVSGSAEVVTNYDLCKHLSC